jgi:amidase
MLGGVGGNAVGATAAEIARAVQRGDTSATQVTVDHLDHVRVANRVLEALRVIRDRAVAAEAEQVDDQPDLEGLPLAGVPVVVSENTPIAGVPTWRGSAAARTGVSPEDHEIVRRLRGAGAVLLGTGRISELALWPTTDDDTGATRHPWRGDRSPGGACGGAAAAVAAGLVPLAHGTDGLGSVRIPAACSGLVGFKPGRGVTDHGLDAWYGLAEHGVLATTVADAALGFAVLAGRPVRPVRDPGRLRVGMSVHSPVPLIGPDRDVRSALARAAHLLVGLEHDVILAEPAYPLGLVAMAAAAWSVIAHDESRDTPGPAARWVSEARTRPGLQPRTRRLAGLGGFAMRRGLLRDADRADWRARCETWFAQHGLDIMILPAVAGPPPVRRWADRSLAANAIGAMRLAAYTAPWSLAGLPALTVPMGIRHDGLPASVQLVGPVGAEARLLAVAAQLERVAPWRRHAPGWPRPAAARMRPADATRRLAAFAGVAAVAPSGHDRTDASNGAGDLGRDRGGPEGARWRRPRNADGTEPAAHGRAGRAGLAQV